MRGIWYWRNEKENILMEKVLKQALIFQVLDWGNLGQYSLKTLIRTIVRSGC